LGEEEPPDREVLIRGKKGTLPANGSPVMV